jgi:hypothetical protein
MVRVGITGHTNLTNDTRRLVSAALIAALRRLPGGRLYGITCLADGADQIFAEAVLASGGTFEVILPAGDYRSTAIRPGNVDRFDMLMSRATRISRLPRAVSDDAAFAAANVAMIERSERLFAVWDGTPGDRPGGTAHAVDLARQRGVPVIQVWPHQARRAHRGPARRTGPVAAAPVAAAPVAAGPAPAGGALRLNGVA